MGFFRMMLDNGMCEARSFHKPIRFKLDHFLIYACVGVTKLSGTMQNDDAEMRNGNYTDVVDFMQAYASRVWTRLERGECAMDDKRQRHLIGIPETMRPRVGAEVVAEMYGLTQSSVTRYARQGIIPSIKIGNLFRFDLVEVEEALRRNQRL